MELDVQPDDLALSPPADAATTTAGSSVAGSPPPGPSTPGPPTPKPRSRTSNNSLACVRCKRSHLRCEAGIPCSRCIKEGKTSLCVPVVHKPRGRKPLDAHARAIRMQREASARQASEAVDKASFLLGTLRQPRDAAGRDAPQPADDRMGQFAASAQSLRIAPHPAPGAADELESSRASRMAGRVHGDASAGHALGPSGHAGDASRLPPSNYPPLPGGSASPPDYAYGQQRHQHQHQYHHHHASSADSASSSSASQPRSDHRSILQNRPARGGSGTFFDVVRDR